MSVAQAARRGTVLQLQLPLLPRRTSSGNSQATSGQPGRGCDKLLPAIQLLPLATPATWPLPSQSTRCAHVRLGISAAPEIQFVGTQDLAGSPVSHFPNSRPAACPSCCLCCLAALLPLLPCHLPPHPSPDHLTPKTSRSIISIVDRCCICEFRCGHLHKHKHRSIRSTPWALRIRIPHILTPRKMRGNLSGYLVILYASVGIC